MARDHHKMDPRVTSPVPVLAAGLLFIASSALPQPTGPVLGGLPALAAAADAAAELPAGPLSLDQAIQRALACDPRVASLQAAVDVARQRRRAATDVKDPELLFDSGDVLDDLGTTASHGGDVRAGVRFFLPNPWLVHPRVGTRAADFRAAQADLEAASWLVSCEVRRSLAEIDYRARDMALATGLARLSGEVLNAVRQRAEQGAATALDVVSATRRHLQTEEDRDQTGHRLRVAQRGLEALLDLAPGSVRDTAGFLPFPARRQAALLLDQAETTARRCRRDLAALHWRVLAATSAYREARNERLPWVKEARVQYRENSGEWWFGCAVGIPLFTWTRNHADAVLQAQLGVAVANETEGLRRVDREVRDALDELAESQRQQARYEGEVAPLIAAMRQTLASLRSVPNAMPDQVAATELQITESERLDLGARQRYHLALIDLERAIGTSLDELMSAKE